MANVKFCYEAKGFISTDMRVVIGENRLLIKDGASADVDVPAGEYDVLYKSSIRFVRQKLKVDGDLTVAVGWDAETGAPCAKAKN